MYVCMYIQKRQKGMQVRERLQKSEQTSTYMNIC